MSETTYTPRELKDHARAVADIEGNRRGFPKFRIRLISWSLRINENGTVQVVAKARAVAPRGGTSVDFEASVAI